MTTTKIRAGIAGAAGYTGGEMLRLLLNHPNVEIAFAQSRSNAGNAVSTIHTDLAGETDLCFTSTAGHDIDVLFLCLGHGESNTYLADNPDIKARIIDLSQDFRLEENASQNSRNFIYGLPELNKEKIATATAIANPGCFATAIQLALLPLAAAGMLNEVHTTGITGATGAGQKLQATSHFTWRANNISAYKSLTHQHLAEINCSINNLQQEAPRINFIPWRGDFTRGIYVSAYTESKIDLEDAYSLYGKYYQDAPFTIVSRNMIDLKQVVNTNKCLIHLERAGEHLIIHSAIDNLLKGASGQAVENMNIMFGLPQTAGLKLKASSF
ncbi:MAG: N-acetyl-gamma-glutamyl-phosphate reductase [Flavipsychrobacter sp.]|nr:N-acetyl-gamma-glutamyl-phosphate reductase [Flavipsychrobacter sp.]